jgi:hypothetical protein
VPVRTEWQWPEGRTVASSSRHSSLRTRCGRERNIWRSSWRLFFPCFFFLTRIYWHWLIQRRRACVADTLWTPPLRAVGDANQSPLSHSPRCSLASLASCNGDRDDEPNKSQGGNPCCLASKLLLHVRLAYQPPISSTFLSKKSATGQMNRLLDEIC